MSLSFGKIAMYLALGLCFIVMQVIFSSNLYGYNFLEDVEEMGEMPIEHQTEIEDLSSDMLQDALAYSEMNNQINAVSDNEVVSESKEASQTTEIEAVEATTILVWMGIIVLGIIILGWLLA